MSSRTSCTTGARGIATITINRPEVRNAFRPLTVDELLAAFQEAWDDEETGVVILTGAGDVAFRSGGDQKVRGRQGYGDGTGHTRLPVPELHASENAVFGQTGPRVGSFDARFGRCSSCAWWARRRHARSGTCAVTTRHRRRWRWAW